MPSEKKTRDRTRERDKDKKIRDKTEKSSSDKYNDRKSTSRTKDSSKGTKEKERDKKREHKDKGDKKEEKERLRKKEEKNSKNHENERKSSKHHNNNENDKRRSSIKQHRNEIVTDDSDISEENIKQETVTTKMVIEDDFNYEDDEFEDYDEDFEEEDEDEEEEEEDDEDDIGHTESKLDSGNYDVQPSRQTSVRMQRELEAVKEAMVRENMGPKSSKQTSELSDDSGRESPTARQTMREEPRKQSGFINFSAAKERNKVQIAAKAANSRGADLQKMIRLDIVNFDLLDLPPIRYTNHQ